MIFFTVKFIVNEQINHIGGVTNNIELGKTLHLYNLLVVGISTLLTETHLF